MTDKQPEALRLADNLDELDEQFSSTGLCGEAAAELRRLHEVNAELMEALKWISTVNAMEYEYQSHAKAAIAKATGEQQ